MTSVERTSAELGICKKTFYNRHLNNPQFYRFGAKQKKAVVWLSKHGNKGKISALARHLNMRRYDVKLLIRSLEEKQVFDWLEMDEEYIDCRLLIATKTV